MKRMIKASSIEQENAMRYAKKIKDLASKLFDAMEETPSGFLDANDLGQLYEELAEVLPALDFAIKSGTVEYQKGYDGTITRFEDFE